MLRRLAGRILGRHLGGEGSALLGAFEAYGPGGRPGKDLALLIRNGNDGVIERGLDMHHALEHLPLLLRLLATRRLLFSHGLLSLLPSHAYRPSRAFPHT